MNKTKHIPFPLAVRASKGDPQAIGFIINYFEGFIVSRAERTVYRPDGSTYRMVDPDVRHRMETELTEMILDFDFR